MPLSERDATKVVATLNRLLPSGDEALLERVSAKVERLYASYEKPGVCCGGCMAVDDLELIRGPDGVYTVSALVLHHFGGDVLGLDLHEPLRNRTPRAAREEFVSTIADYMRQDARANLTALHEFATTRIARGMSLCSASAQAPLQEGRDGAPPTADDHASNVRVMRMDALLVGGLWHFDLVPWNTFNRTLAYVMGLGDLQEDGLPQVVLPRDPLDSLATDVCEGEPRAVLAARAHILLKMIQVDPASKGVFICRLCNFASVLMWLVLMCMDRLLREKVQYARLLRVLLPQITQLLLQEMMEARRGLPGCPPPSFAPTISQVHLAASLSEEHEYMTPDLSEPPVHLASRRFERMAELLWELLAASKKEPDRYDFARVPKGEVRRGMRRVAADIRGSSKLMAFGFGPGTVNTVISFVHRLDALTPPFKHARFESKLLQWMAQFMLSVCQAVRKHHVHPFVFKLLLLLYRLRDIKGNVRLWTALFEQAHWALKDKSDEFVALHHRFLPDRETLLAKAALVDDAEGRVNLNIASEVDYTNGIMRHICQLALLAGDVRRKYTGDAPIGVPWTNGPPQHEAEELERWRDKLLRTAHGALLRCPIVPCFRVPFLANTNEWAMALCTLLWRPQGPEKWWTEMRELLAKPCARLMRHIEGNGFDALHHHSLFALHVAYDPTLENFGDTSREFWLGADWQDTRSKGHAALSLQEREELAARAASELLAEEEREKTQQREKPTKLGKRRAKQKAKEREASPSPPPPASSLAVAVEAAGKSKATKAALGPPTGTGMMTTRAADGSVVERLAAFYIPASDASPSGSVHAVRAKAQEQRAVAETLKAKAVGHTPNSLSRLMANAAEADATKLEQEARAADAAAARDARPAVLVAASDARPAALAAAPQAVLSAPEAGWSKCQKKGARRARARAHAPEETADDDMQRALERSREEHEREQELSKQDADSLEQALAASTLLCPPIEPANKDVQCIGIDRVGAGVDHSEPKPATEPEPAKPATECVVCLEGDATHVLVPCGHHCLCAQCAKAQKQCPLCRAPVTQTVRLYSA